MAKFMLSLLIAVCFLGCSSQFFQTIQTAQNATTKPANNCVNIKTRIIIEYNAAYINSLVTTQESKSTVILATSIEDIKNELNNAEKIYESMNLKFSIQEVKYVKQEKSWTGHQEDATQNKDCLSMYFLLPGDFPVMGCAYQPWHPLYGAYFSFFRDQWCVTHEIGHAFGLNHTFIEDACDDTDPQTKEQTCDNVFNFIQLKSLNEKMPNCGNIMNYCPHLPKYITKDQINRMKMYLLKDRIQWILPENEESIHIDCFIKNPIKYN